MGTTIPIRSVEDIEKLKQYFLGKGQYRNYTLFVMGINTALRISDLLRLEWNDVLDPGTGTWRDYIALTEHKTGKWTVIFLNQSVKDALALYRAALPEAPGRQQGHKLFCNNRDKTCALTRTQAYQIIRKACRENRIAGNISCHSLRKTFGYHAWKRNVPEVMLMDIYNHSSFSVTRCYLGIGQDDRDEVFRKMNL